MLEHMDNPIQEGFEVIRNARLDNIRLAHCHVESTIRSVEEAVRGPASISHGCRLLAEPEGTAFTVLAELEFSLLPGPRPDAPAPPTTPLVRIAVGYHLIYEMPPTSAPPVEALEAFARVNGSFHAWPYWREFIASTLTRMGLPGFLLPVYRLNVGNPEEKE